MFTIPESAKYLGKSLMTLRKWIQDNLVPPPVLTDTVHGYLHYDRYELQAIAKILHRHERDFSYLHHTHEVTINSIWQALEAHRK